MSAASTNDVLDQVLDPLTECLTPEVARRIADLRATPSVQQQLDELADKANEGALSDAERAKYDTYLSAYHLITILQAKARTFLEKQPNS